MQEFLNRPYRDRRVRQQRKAQVVVYRKKLAALKKEPVVQPGSILVSPELVELAGDINAGIISSDTESTDSGA